MSEVRCEMIRERLPDFAGNRLSPADAAAVQAHLHECRECAGEAELVRLLFAGRPASPEDLTGRLEVTARTVRRRTYHPWWGVAAASVAALALGIGVVARDRPSVEIVEEVQVPGIVAGAEETSLWLADDGVVAGAPSLEGLSDEALLVLLDELGTETTGGST